MGPGTSYFNSINLSWLHIRNRLSLKPLSVFNTVITNFNVKNPFHGQHSICHWSWDITIRTSMKSLESTSSKASLEPSPSFFPWWQLPQFGQLLNLNRTSTCFAYSFSALIFWVYLLWIWCRCICININSYSKFQESRDGAHGNILWLWYLCLKSFILWNVSKINQVFLLHAWPQTINYCPQQGKYRNWEGLETFL